MKYFVLMILFIWHSWCGWYSSEDIIELAIGRATEHPLSLSNGAIFDEKGNMRGSGVIVNKNLVLTASHLGSPEAFESYFFSQEGSLSLKNLNKIKKSYKVDGVDLCFLEVVDSFSIDHVACIIPPLDNLSLVEALEYKPPLPDQGAQAIFFGCGDKMVSGNLDAKDRQYVASLQDGTRQSDRLFLTRSFGQKALGECMISQSFKEESSIYFYSWMNVQDKKKSFTSSALSGDSGGGMFVKNKEREESYYLGGIVSELFVNSEWDKGVHHVGTRVIGLYPPKGEESYLDMALRKFSLED